jgi:lipopolysaccharide export LptBFGC system permease protein LptF
MRIQRYLLGELLTAFALIALIVTGVLFAAMLLQFLHRYPDLNLLSVLRAAPYIVPLAFPITLPLSFLIACLLTYGRFAEENEFLALQMGGVHPWHAASPAIASAAVLALGTVLLNTDVIPLATLAKKEIARGEVRELLKAVDDPSRTEIRLGDFQMSWNGRDERGLRDVLITWAVEVAVAGADRKERTVHRVRASRGRIDVNRLGSDALYLDLDDVEMQVREGERVTRVNEAQRLVAISIDQIAGAPPALESKGTDEMSASQLWYRAKRLRETLRSGDDAASRSERSLLYRFETDYWRRIAMGLAPFSFAFVGVGIGLGGSKGGRMAAFLTAVVVALPVYYPLLLWGANLSRAGLLPAALALNLCNAILVGVGLWRMGRVVG